MTTGASFSDTLRLHRLFRQGVSPGQIIQDSQNNAHAKVQRIMTELIGREQAAEAQIANLTAGLEGEQFNGLNQQKEATQEVLDDLQQFKDELSKNLAEAKKKLKEQTEKKEDSQKDLNNYLWVLQKADVLDGELRKLSDNACDYFNNR